MDFRGVGGPEKNPLESHQGEDLIISGEANRSLPEAAQIHPRTASWDGQDLKEGEELLHLHTRISNQVPQRAPFHVLAFMDWH